jgi:predicted Rossmann-fold nucleotide-binding protein
LLVDMADAVISVSGRIGSLHEFTSAFERKKIIGLLLNSGGLANDIPEILEKARRGMGRVIMHADPAELVDLVFEAVDALEYA